MNDFSPPSSSAVGPVHLICFSKDRAFQLKEYLRSCLEHLHWRGTTGQEREELGGESGRLHISVLYASTPDFEGSYRHLQKLFPDVNFVKETDFASQLVTLVQRFADGFVLFGVDDAVYYRDLDLQNAIEFIRADEMKNIACHLKLSPGVTFCHPSTSVMQLPSLRLFRPEELPLLEKPGRKRGEIGTWSTRDERESARNGGERANGHSQELGNKDGRVLREREEEILFFSLGEGSHDWDYPWELCGTLFSQRFVLSVLERIKTDHGERFMSHPNYLEVYGNKVVKAMAKENGSSFRPQYCGCLARPAMAVITVNRVQDIFQNPIYLAVSGGGEGQGALEERQERIMAVEEGDLYFLDSLLWQGQQELDLEWYSKQQFNSVHVGDFRLRLSGVDGQDRGTLTRPLPHTSAPTLRRKPRVSVLLPVYNAERTVEAAVDSVLRQSLTDFELIIVDDGSTDGSLSLMQTIERREEEKDRQEGRERNRVKVISLTTNQGIVSALNHGLKHCEGEYVARQDADDISHPRRLERQYHFLSSHPCLSVVGCALVLFEDERDGESERKKHKDGERVVRYPTDPLFTSWSLYFGCSLPHPGIMVRRSSILSLGGYRVQYQYAEDFDLWHRLQQEEEDKEGTRSLKGHYYSPRIDPAGTDHQKDREEEEGNRYRLNATNVGDVLLYYRKHPSALSSVKHKEQREKTLQILTEAWQRRLSSLSLRKQDIRVILSCDEAERLEEIQRAISALESLERQFISLPRRTLGEGDGTQQKGDNKWEEIALRAVKEDASARIGALANHAMKAFPGREAGKVWARWVNRDRDRALKQFTQLLSSS